MGQEAEHEAFWCVLLPFCVAFGPEDCKLLNNEAPRIFLSILSNSVLLFDAQYW